MAIGQGRKKGSLQKTHDNYEVVYKDGTIEKYKTVKELTENLGISYRIIQRFVNKEEKYNSKKKKDILTINSLYRTRYNHPKSLSQFVDCNIQQKDDCLDEA